ncbi:hypothetical protein APUTEX25_001197, partial [Auxenochlorella protothecoides]
GSAHRPSNQLGSHGRGGGWPPVWGEGRSQEDHLCPAPCPCLLQQGHRAAATAPRGGVAASLCQCGLANNAAGSWPPAHAGVRPGAAPSRIGPLLG